MSEPEQVLAAIDSRIADAEAVYALTSVAADEAKAEYRAAASALNSLREMRQLVVVAAGISNLDARAALLTQAIATAGIPSEETFGALGSA